MEQPLTGFFSSLNSQRQHARTESEAASNSRIIEHSPSESASKATDTGLLSKPRAYRKRVRAEDLWDRDEEELLQRRAKELTTADTLAGAGAGEKPQRSQPEYVGPSGTGQDLHGFGGAGDDLLHSDLIEGREQGYTRPEPDALNHAEDKISSGSPGSQSHPQAYTQVESGAFNHTEDNVLSRSPKSQSHVDLERSRDRYLGDFSIVNDTELEPQKRSRNSAGYTQPSTIDKDLPHKESQDALIDVFLKKLADEQGTTRAVKQELKRLQYHDKDLVPKKRKKDKKKTAAVQRKKDQAGQILQKVVSADTPSPRKVPGGTGHVGKRRETDQAVQTNETLLTADTPSLRDELNHNGRLAAFTKFGSLPANVQDIVFGMLLQSSDPIKFDTTRLMAFVHDNVDVPSAALVDETRKKYLLKPAHILQLELEKLKADVHNISPPRWPSRSVVHGLTLSLLLVSKLVHQRAAKAFYSNNVFEFPDVRDAWLHLEFFLVTIGARNANNIQYLSVAAPKWHPDDSEDQLASAFLGALSPVTRLVASTNATEDRLFSAISNCTSILAAQGLNSLRINLNINDAQPFLKHRVNASTYELSGDEKNAHAKRRDRGIQLLNALSRRALSPGCKPELVIDTGAFGTKHKFLIASVLEPVKLMARKYRWVVNEN